MNEIERAVRTILEQDFDQVDYGDPGPEGEATRVDLYARSCTIGDDEEANLGEDLEVEGLEEWKSSLSPPLSQEEVNRLAELVLDNERVTRNEFCDDVLEILLPYVSHRDLYDNNYERWEEWLYGTWNEFEDD